MRTRWILTASILISMVALIPGALRAAETPGNAPPAVVAPTAPAPVAETLLPWEPALVQQLPLPGEVVREPIFLISCSSCTPELRCVKLRACVLAGCC